MGGADADRSDREAEAPKPRQISWLWFFLAVIAVGLLLEFRGGLLSSRRSDGMGVDHPAVGRGLHDLRLQSLTGNSQDLNLDDLKGDVTVVNFWGTWCPPCRAEFPELAALWVQMRSREHFRLLAVSCDGEDSDLDSLREETGEFLNKQQSQLPTYADQNAFTRRNVAMVLGTLGESGFPGYPTTIVLDQDGVIRGFWVGYEPQIADQIRHLVGELLPADDQQKDAEKTVQN